MFSPSTRKALHEACRLFGSIRSVARETGLDAGNLSRWLLGNPTLSEEKVQVFLDYIGLPGMVPRRDIVHEWRMKGVILGDYPAAFALYFPSGAQIARAPWSQPGPKHVAASFHPANMTKSEAFAVTDGRVRAVIRLNRNLIIQPDNLGHILKWRNGDLKQSVLAIADNDERWLKGPLSVEAFNEGWGVYEGPLSIDFSDLLALIQELGISYEEAARRIRNFSSSTF